MNRACVLARVFLILPALFVSCGEDGVTVHSSFVDPRDNKKYETLRAGSTQWMAEDLRLGDSLSFSYQQSLNACPPGWSLPSEEDWIGLCNFFGGYILNQDEYGNPKEAYLRFANEFKAPNNSFFWSRTPAWRDAPSFRSTSFYLSTEGMVVAPNAASSKVRCRCIKKEREQISDVIQFQVNGDTRLYDSYSFQQPGDPEIFYIILHRKIGNAKVLTDRVILSGALPGQLIGPSGSLEAEQAWLETQYRDEDMSLFESADQFYSSDQDFVLKFTSYDGKHIIGTFTGTSNEGIRLDQGYFAVTLN
jgi:hypothetical protein